MVDISLLLPTRGRPSLVYRLFDSIVETVSNPKRLEVVLYLDEDDLKSQEISHSILSIIKLIGPSISMGGLNSACYRASKGNYVMILNDDVIFRTQDWDEKVLNAFARFSDDIALVYGNDLISGKTMPTFPILSRTVCELMGEICPSEYKSGLIDDHIFEIFKLLGVIGYNRIIYLEEVIFEHMHYMLGKSKCDETYLKGDYRIDEPTFFNFRRKRQDIAIKLAQYIEEKDNKKMEIKGIDYDILKKRMDDFQRSEYKVFPFGLERVEEKLSHLVQKNIRRIICYGSGSHLERILRNKVLDRAGLKILAISDSNANKWGKEVKGIKVISPKEILEFKPEAIFITSVFVEDIYKNLKYLESQGIKIYDMSRYSMHTVYLIKGESSGFNL